MLDLRNKKIAFIDTETTGLPGHLAPEEFGRTHVYGWPRIVEVCCLVESEGKELGRLDAFPLHPDFRIPPEARAVHGIDDARGDTPLRDVLDELFAMLRDADCIVGHNVRFDLKVITSEMADLGLRPEFRTLLCKPTVDTMKQSVDFCDRHLLGGGKIPKLKELYGVLFGREISHAHTALGDVLATRECFHGLLDQGVELFEEFI